MVAVPRDANWSDVVVYSTHSQNCSDNFFYQNVRGLRTKKAEFHDSVSCTEDNVIQAYVYWTVRHIDIWTKIDQPDVTYFIISLFNL